MFWGCMSSYGVGDIVQINARHNAMVYVGILENYLLPYVHRTYGRNDEVNILQDRSSIPTAHRVQHWVEQHLLLMLLPQAAKSPDLNPIENLWAIMIQDWVSGQDRNAEQLMNHVVRVWESLREKLNVIAKCMSSMPSRLNEVLNNNGYWTSY